MRQLVSLLFPPLSLHTEVRRRGGSNKETISLFVRLRYQNKPCNQGKTTLFLKQPICYAYKDAQVIVKTVIIRILCKLKK